MRALRHKRPNPDTRFSWGRVIGDGGAITYRLFRRDFRRAIHTTLLRFAPGTDRCAIAEELRNKRHELRERVDKIEFHLMGLSA